MQYGDDTLAIETTSAFVTAPDGLKLHVRCYGPRLAPSVPVVCLPGLTRTVADFEELAILLAGNNDQPRRVLALDSRGRGLSEYDRNPQNYNLTVELADLRAVLTALDVQPAVFVGTSRGGLLIMLLAVAQPTAIAGAILNDIGPVIEPKGLARIKSYVGKMPEPKSFEEGAEIFRRLFGPHFTGFTDADWLAYSRRSFRIDQHRLAPTYDVRIAKTMEGIDFDQPLPPMWGAFDALGRVPLMVLRGENSDLLSEATLSAMRSRRPSMEVVTVPRQGHAPVIGGTEMLQRLATFVAGCDRSRPGWR
jgi:pimeloyl-ACP methyl ester carboxylesterase